MTNLVRKDLFVCLGIWLALEVVCFAILPALQLSLPRTSLQSWFLFSLLLGVGGAVLTASSTQLDEFLQTQETLLSRRVFRSFSIFLLSWLGLLGIGFPLLVMSLQICDKIFGLIKG
jgi:hypothetical protein